MLPSMILYLTTDLEKTELSNHGLTPLSPWAKTNLFFPLYCFSQESYCSNGKLQGLFYSKNAAWCQLAPIAAKCKVCVSSTTPHGEFLLTDRLCWPLLPLILTHWACLGRDFMAPPPPWLSSFNGWWEFNTLYQTDRVNHRSSGLQFSS